MPTISPTTTTLSSTPNPSVSGQAVALTAKVTPSTATGTMTFKDGSTTLGTSPLGGGSATLTVSTLSIGAHSLTAVYGGDFTNTTSTSSVLTQTVNGISSASPCAPTFSFTIGQTPPSNVVCQFNAFAPASFTVSTTASWLQVSPSSGTLDVSGTSFNVSLNTAGLAPGPYIGSFTISGPQLGSVTVPVQLTVTAAAPVTTPSGPYGFLISSSYADPTNQPGLGLLGLMNFDGAGNANGSYTLQTGALGDTAPTTQSGTFTGTYSGNSDGTGSVTLTTDNGLSLTLATVLADGGHSLQFVATSLSCATCNISGTVINGIGRSAAVGSVKGAYAFQLNNTPTPSGAIGLISFDGAGNVTLSYTSVDAGQDISQPPVSTGTLSGTYALNPDGSGTVNLPAPPGQSGAAAFALVMTDGGSGLLLLRTQGPRTSISWGVAKLQ
jgi:hypothetical protein